jgi:hypothetical protein
MVTGTDVGNHFIIPGTYASRNFKISYLPADLSITAAELTATTAANPTEITFGDTTPSFSTTFEGFGLSTTFRDENNSEITLRDDQSSVVESITYSLKKENTTISVSDKIPGGTYQIQPLITLFSPSNFVVTTINQGNLTVKRATPTVVLSVPRSPIEFTGNPVSASAIAYGLGGPNDLLNQSLIAFSYTGTGTTTYGPTTSAPIWPGTYSVVATYLGDENYQEASSAPASITIIGCINEAPVVAGFATAKGSGNTSNPAIINRPANTVAGDLLVVGLMFEKGQSPSVTPPSGWQLIRRTNQLNQVAMVTFYKIATANEPSTYGFRISQSPKWTMGISRISGADVNHKDGPIVTDSGASGASAMVATAPSLTTAECNTLVLAFFTNKQNATWTAPSGFTEVYDDPNNQQGLTSNMMAFSLRNDPGPTGEISARASVGESWAAQAIAVRPKAKGVILRTTSEITVERNPIAFMEEELGMIKTYPNPVKDKFNIILNGYLDEAPSLSSLALHDALGRTLNWKGTWNADERRIELDFSDLNSGIYFIRIQTKNGLKSIRVIKN